MQYPYAWVEEGQVTKNKMTDGVFKRVKMALGEEAGKGLFISSHDQFCLTGPSDMPGFK